MKVPISWIKDYTKMHLKLSNLMWRMTEVGMTCESYEKIGNETVFEVEVTPNRPDWMSISGIAREIALLENQKYKNIILKPLSKPRSNLPLKIKNDFGLIERWSGVIIKEVTIGKSPKFIQDRLKLCGFRPINNIVDITNYVMIEMGIPLHAFDYEKIEGSEMEVKLAKGGEEFESVDNIKYELPKDAMIICDAKKIIDLVGIKGGANSGISKKTKTIFLHATIDNPVLIRRASQKLALRSDASAILERGPDKGGTKDAVVRAANLIEKYAKGRIASELYDLKKKEFAPVKLSLSKNKLDSVLGISIPVKNVIAILYSLNFSPKLKGDLINCTIPTYRSDVTIQEDLIEEVARFYGYNNIPKTTPKGQTNREKIPYHYDRTKEILLKNIMMAMGFNEEVTYSLISKALISECSLNLDNHISLVNPVSKDYAYLRNSLIPSLLSSVKLNQGGFENIRLFEYAKIFYESQKSYEEEYKLSAITNTDFDEIKGVVDLIIKKYGIQNTKYSINPVQKSIWQTKRSGEVEVDGKILATFGQISEIVTKNLKINKNCFAFELDIDTLNKYSNKTTFEEIVEYPPQVEDITLTLPEGVFLDEVIKYIKSQIKISEVTLTNSYKERFTLRVNYQSKKSNLSNLEVKKIRNKYLKGLKEKYSVSVK